MSRKHLENQIALQRGAIIFGEAGWLYRTTVASITLLSKEEQSLARAKARTFEWDSWARCDGDARTARCSELRSLLGLKCGEVMKKVKVSEASGVVLDWMVAKCEGYTATLKPTEVVYTHPDGTWHHNRNWNPSGNWTQGGPIIERESIDIEWDPNGKPVVRAQTWVNKVLYQVYGPTPLIAAMRCLVVSKCGLEVEVPEQLV